MGKGKRNRTLKKILVRVPGRDPNEPEEPDPGYPDGLGATGELVDIEYTGPLMTPWTVCYVWATVLTNIRDWQPSHGPFGAFDTEDSPSRVLLARAISITARERGLLGDEPVAGPGVLSPLSVPMVGIKRMNPVIKPAFEFTMSHLGHTPAPGELGYQPYLEVYEAFIGRGAAAQPGEQGDQDAERMLAQAQAAFDALMVAVTTVGTALRTDVSFGQLGAYLNDYLRSTSLPDQDTRFRIVLEQKLGWPGGNPPAGIRTHPGPWYKVGFAPNRTPGHEVSLAWCQWLLDRGWAELHSPDIDADGIWLAVPGDWAESLLAAANDLGCRPTSIMQWPTWRNSGQERPADEFLRMHYGRPS